MTLAAEKAIAKPIKGMKQAGLPDFYDERIIFKHKISARNR
jgi:hypothetical protein